MSVILPLLLSIGLKTEMESDLFIEQGSMQLIAYA